MNKRGQAAMEFLMTYGWAILAAIIAIGVLAYFGVFNPGKLAGNQGIINAPFNMDAFRITANPDAVTMEVTQNLGESIRLAHTGAGLSNALLLTLETPTSGACTMATSSTPNVFTDIVPAGGDSVGDNTWAPGVRHTFIATCSALYNWAPGDQVKGTLTVTYRTTGSSINQQSTGAVRGTSQA